MSHLGHRLGPNGSFSIIFSKKVSAKKFSQKVLTKSIHKKFSAKKFSAKNCSQKVVTKSFHKKFSDEPSGPPYTSIATIYYYIL